MDSYTRDNNTTQYTANDWFADSTNTTLTFAIPGGNSYVNKGEVPYAWLINARCYGDGNWATVPQLNLHLFSAANDAGPTDNAACAMVDSDMANCLGIVYFNNWDAGDDTTGAGGNSFSVASIAQPILINTDTNCQFYGLVKVKNAFTPLSAESFYFTLDLELP